MISNKLGMIILLIRITLEIHSAIIGGHSKVLSGMLDELLTIIINICPHHSVVIIGNRFAVGVKHIVKTLFLLNQYFAGVFNLLWG
jgi:hypothetical protein